MTEKLFLAVASDEPYMPVRLHFAIRKQKVYDLFQKLGSVDYDTKTKAFDWYHEDELELAFAFDKSGVPKGHDLLLAQMKFVGQDKLLIICNSYKKALAALEYFPTQLSTKFLKLVEVDMCNWVYDGNEENMGRVQNFGFDLFDQQAIPLLDSGRLMRIAKQLEEEGKSPEEALNEATARLEEEDKNPYPEYHKRIIGPSREDRESMALVLMLIQRVAMRRFADGNCDYGLSDAAADLDGELYGEED